MEIARQNGSTCHTNPSAPERFDGGGHLSHISAATVRDSLTPLRSASSSPPRRAYRLWLLPPAARPAFGAAATDSSDADLVTDVAASANATRRLCLFRARPFTIKREAAEATVLL